MAILQYSSNKTCNICNPSVNLGALLHKKQLSARPEFLAMLEKRTPTLAKKVSTWLSREGKRIALELSSAMASSKVDLGALLGKATKKTPQQMVQGLDLSGWDALAGIITDDTYDVFRSAYEDGLDVYGQTDLGVTSQMDARALSWAQQRGAELVGNKVDEDGNIIENPDAKWAITDSTRDMLQRTIQASVKAGDSPRQLQQRIEDSVAFGDTRASTIARTELATAHIQGNKEGWTGAGVEFKKSALGSAHDLDDECDEAEADGAIPMDDLFSNGYDAPPYHPNCVCDLLPVLNEKMLKGAPIGNTNASKDHIKDAIKDKSSAAYGGELPKQGELRRLYHTTSIEAAEKIIASGSFKSAKGVGADLAEASYGKGNDAADWVYLGTSKDNSQDAAIGDGVTFRLNAEPYADKAVMQHNQEGGIAMIHSSLSIDSIQSIILDSPSKRGDALIAAWKNKVRSSNKSITSLSLLKSDFDESKHPRTKDGRFGTVDASNIPPVDKERLRKLGCPLTYTDIKLNPDPKGDLQATARNENGKKQYFYSDEHNANSAREKFERQVAFDKISQGIYDKAKADMNNPSLTAAQRDAAAATYLISQTGFRIGSDKDTGAEKKAYGASNLQASHVLVDGDKLSFSFTGKHGVGQDHTITDPSLAAYISSKGITEGRLFQTSDQGVRDYFHSIAGKDYLVKDMRTQMATLTALKAIKDMPAPSSEKEYKSFRNKVGDIVSSVLGNTRGMALNEYIHPAVFSSWGFQ